MIFSRAIVLVFWLIVLIGAFPAIVANSLLPHNWVIPFAVWPIDDVIFSKTARYIWMSLFAVTAACALWRRSLVFLLATGPLLTLALIPISEINIDLSQPNDSAYLTSRAEALVLDIDRELPKDVQRSDDYLQQQIEIINDNITYYKDLEENARGGIFAGLSSIYAEKIAKYEEGKAYLRAENKALHRELLPPDEAIRTTLNFQPQLPKFALFFIDMKGVKIFRASALADLDNDTLESVTLAMEKSLAILEFNHNATIEFYTGLLSLLSLLSVSLFAIFGIYRFTFIAVLLIGGLTFAFMQTSILTTYSVVQAIMLILFLAFLRYLWHENKLFLQTLGARRNFGNIGRILVAWSPFAVLFICSIIFSAALTTILKDQIYSITLPSHNAEGDKSYFAIAKSSEGLETDLQTAADRQISYFQDSVRRETDQILEDYQSVSEGSVDETMDALDDAIDDKIFSRGQFRNCLKPPSLACPLINEVKHAINWSYGRARKRQLNKIEGELDQLALGGENATESAVDVVQANIDAAAFEMSQWSRKGIRSVFRWHAIISAISISFLCFVLVKSFVFIASRIYLNADKVNTDVSEQIAPENTGSSPKAGDKTYIFDQERWGTFFVRRGQSNKNIKRDIAWPQPFIMLFRRLTSGIFATYREDWSRDQGEKFVKNTKGGEYVEWQLATGQEIVFRMGNLAAFSEGITLRSVWSFRMSHFIFGRVLFSSAKGPGMILLRTNGEPHIGNEGDHFVLGAAPNEHIAFDLNTDFLVNSDLKLKNIYFSDIEVIANDSARVVVDVMPEHSFVGGASRFIRAFFIPV